MTLRKGSQIAAEPVPTIPTGAGAALSRRRFALLPPNTASLDDFQRELRAGHLIIGPAVPNGFVHTRTRASKNTAAQADAKRITLLDVEIKGREAMIQRHEKHIKDL